MAARDHGRWLAWDDPATRWDSFTESTRHVVEPVYEHTEQYGLFT